MVIKIPNTWVYSPLNDLILLAIGGDWGIDPKIYKDGYIEVLCIRGADIRDWLHHKGKTAARRKIKTSSLEIRKLQIGDILLEISGGGPEQPVGRTLLVDNSVLLHEPETPKICTNFFRLLRSSSYIDSQFLNYFLGFFYFCGDIVNYQGGSNNLRNLKFKEYLTINVPLPPLPEQHRIVTKIEELFSLLDEAVAGLKRAQAQLKVYRQALLKAAFSGELTKAWREEHAAELETAEALLARIKAERAARYREQLASWQAEVQAWEDGGKTGKKPSKPQAPKELPPLSPAELAGLPELPKGWGYFQLDLLGNLSRGKSKHRPRNDPKLFGGKYPFIQTGNVKAQTVITNYDTTYNEIGLAQSLLWPKGTLCITIAANIAETAILGIDACFPDSIVGFIKNNCLIDEKIIQFFIMSIKEKIESYAPATAQKNINLNILENLIVPYCGQSEQKFLVEILDCGFSKIDQLSQAIDQSLLHADALRQAILKKAFSGRLVPQDPGDEPAAVLLERIRAERAVLPPSGQKRTRRP